MKKTPRSRGATLLARYIRGERLTRQQAILAKCCECMGGYIDGLADCGIETCPLRQFSPYRTKTSAGTTDPKEHTDQALSTLPNARRKRSTAKDGTMEVTP
jgi:hypothetical protein